MTILDILRAPGDKEPIVLEGNQVYEFEDAIKMLPASRVNHHSVLTATKEAKRIVGYAVDAPRLPRCQCRTIFGFQGRAEGVSPTGCQIHGLTLREMIEHERRTGEADIIGHFAGSTWWAER